MNFVVLYLCIIALCISHGIILYLFLTKRDEIEPRVAEIAKIAEKYVLEGSADVVALVFEPSVTVEPPGTGEPPVTGETDDETPVIGEPSVTIGGYPTVRLTGDGKFVCSRLEVKFGPRDEESTTIHPRTGSIGPLVTDPNGDVIAVENVNVDRLEGSLTCEHLDLGDAGAFSSALKEAATRIGIVVVVAATDDDPSSPETENGDRTTENDSSGGVANRHKFISSLARVRFFPGDQTNFTDCFLLTRGYDRLVPTDVRLNSSALADGRTLTCKRDGNFLEVSCHQRPLLIDKAYFDDPTYYGCLLSFCDDDRTSLRPIPNLKLDVELNELEYYDEDGGGRVFFLALQPRYNRIAYELTAIRSYSVYPASGKKREKDELSINDCERSVFLRINRNSTASDDEKSKDEEEKSERAAGTNPDDSMETDEESTRRIPNVLFFDEKSRSVTSVESSSALLRTLNDSRSFSDRQILASNDDNLKLKLRNASDSENSSSNAPSLLEVVAEFDETSNEIVHVLGSRDASEAFLAWTNGEAVADRNVPITGEKIGKIETKFVLPDEFIDHAKLRETLRENHGPIEVKSVSQNTVELKLSKGDELYYKNGSTLGQAENFVAIFDRDTHFRYVRQSSLTYDSTDDAVAVKSILLAGTNLNVSRETHENFVEFSKSGNDDNLILTRDAFVPGSLFKSVTAPAGVWPTIVSRHFTGRPVYARNKTSLNRDEGITMHLLKTLPEFLGIYEANAYAVFKNSHEKHTMCFEIRVIDENDRIVDRFHQFCSGSTVETNEREAYEWTSRPVSVRFVLALNPGKVYEFILTVTSENVPSEKWIQFERLDFNLVSLL